MNPGLVDEGTRCGDGMVCELQRCVSLSSQSFPTCPSSSGQQCSGPTRGVNVSTAPTPQQLNAYYYLCVMPLSPPPPPPLPLLPPPSQVCNNRGTCSCNVGFAGSACQNTRSTGTYMRSGFYPVGGGSFPPPPPPPPNVRTSPQKDFVNEFVLPPMHQHFFSEVVTTKTQKCILI